MNRFILLLTILSNSFLYAQNKFGESYIVYINYPDYTIKATVVSDFKKIITNDTLTYYWYASNKILKTQGGFDGKLLSGPFTSFYLSSALKEKGSFKNGLKNGTWYYWSENGKSKKVSNWKNGMLNGNTKEFDENGNIKLIINYKNGQLHGDYFQYAKDTISLKKKFKKGREVMPKTKKTKTDSQLINSSSDSKKNQENNFEKGKKDNFFKRKTKNKTSEGESGKKTRDTPQSKSPPSQIKDR